MAGLNKYRAYSEYNFTNIEGLVQLPSQWELKQVRYLLKDGAEGTKIGPFGSSLKLEDMVDDGVQVYGQENVIKRDFSLGKRRISFNKFKEMGVYQVFFGDILITMMGTSGKCEIVPQTAEKGIIDSHLIRVRVNNKKIIPDFFKLLVDESPEIKHQIKIQGKGSIMLGLNSGVIRSLYLPLPGISEQKLILGFLDYETKKIDNLIEKQQQLIELLKEKRQAVISHAVTKGLNPDVPMKDSGVEWLGEVPEHWTIAQLKFNTLEMQTGPFGSQLHAEDYMIDGIPLINPAHMNAGMIIPDPKVTVDEATQERLERHKLSEGEIIFSRRGELGRCAVVKKNNEGWLCGTGSLKAKLTKKIIPDYAYTLISSEGVVSELTLESKGSTMANLNTETLGRIRLPIPPISEQEATLDYIKIISDKYDYLIRSADTAIRLMQERRTALISAAVTGKIDVRDWVAPEAQDVEEPQEATA